MRYSINFCKTVNQLVPHYIGGRKLILFLQSLAKPLQILNESFVAYAKETRIEAAMTSQKFYFEWYLNRKFSKYFASGGQISITNGGTLGVPIYNEDAQAGPDNLVLYQQSEAQGVPFYRENERTAEHTHSFVVNSPAINTSMITADQYAAMLANCIERYRLAGKTYVININAQ